MNYKIQTNRGVTLMELMILSVIIGIISAMAVPRFQIAYDRMKFSSEQRNITSTIRLARSYAITNKDQYGVYFDGVGMTTTLFRDIVNPGAMSYEVGDSLLRVDSLPAEFSYIGTDCNNHVVVFQPNGSASFTGGGNIYTVAVTEKVVAISQYSILASTGRVSTHIWCY